MGRLLLVDDDPDLILAQINQVFGASQHRIDVARTGTEGIRRVAERPPDVVLLDLRLPARSGWGASKKSRAWERGFPSSSAPWPKARTGPTARWRRGANDYWS